MVALPPVLWFRLTPAKVSFSAERAAVSCIAQQARARKCCFCSPSTTRAASRGSWLLVTLWERPRPRVSRAAADVEFRPRARNWAAEAPTSGLLETGASEGRCLHFPWLECTGVVAAATRRGSNVRCLYYPAAKDRLR